jgi:hypothetical protein
MATNRMEAQKLKKVRLICMFIIPLTAFMGTMKVMGVFKGGLFPWYFEFILCVGTLIHCVGLSKKIAKINSEQNGDPKEIQPGEVDQ